MAGNVLSQTCGAGGRPWLRVRPGYTCYVGPDLGVEMHSASLGVLGVGLDAPFRFEMAGHDAVDTRVAYAPARSAHRIVAPEGRIMLLFVDPASAPAHSVAATLDSASGPFRLGHQRADELIAASAEDSPDALLSLVCSAADRAADPRITRLAGHIRTHPQTAFRAQEAAGRLGLSTFHFQRLFAQTTGTTFRRYQQWARMLDVARGLSEGHDLTRCAADAGFASPSHLSHVFHLAFGVPPRKIQQANILFDVATAAAAAAASTDPEISP